MQALSYGVMIRSVQASVWNMHRRGYTRVTKSNERCRYPLNAYQIPARGRLRPELASPPRLQASGSARAVHVARSAMPAYHASDHICLCGLALLDLIRRAWVHLRGMLQPLMMMSVAVVATWGAAQISIHRALAATLQPAPFASITASYPLEEFNRWVVYNMQKFFSQGILAKIAAVAAFAVPLVLVFGYLYRRTSGKSMDDSMFQVYSILQDTPGATACDEEDKASGFILNLVWVIGLFSYALVLGIVSDDVAKTAEGFSQGNTTIVESGHTVVLNVNSTTEDMLRQWALAQKERGQVAPIVLLADKPKEDLDRMVDTIKAETRMDVMAREGVPYDVDDLRLVSANKAKTVIVMDPSQTYGGTDEESEVKVQPSSATLVSLAALGDSDTCILLQLPHRDDPMTEHEADMLRSATHLHIGTAAHPKLVQVDALQSIRDAKTQCAVSPGVAGFYQEIFNHSDNTAEVYCKEIKGIDGMTFREARHRFKDATLLGFSRGGVVHANPGDDVLLTQGDSLFGIANTNRQFCMSKPIVPDTEPWVLPANVPDARARHVVVAAFASPADETLRCISDCMPPDGSLTIICPEPVKMPAGKFRKHYIKGHPGTAALLQRAGVDTADSLLLAGMHDWSKTEADIQVLCSMAQLSDLMTASPRRQPLHVVAEARGPLLEEFADRLKALQKRKSATEHWQLLTTDVLPTEQLLAGVIAQCGMQPELSDVLKELFDVENAAVTVRHPLKYMAYGETVALEKLQERARQHGEIVLGAVDSTTKGSVLINKKAIVRHCDVKSLIVLSG